MLTTVDQRDPDSYLKTFYAVVREYQSLYPDWRLGQIYFNALEHMDPVYAGYVRGSLVDPYNDDRKIPDFIAWLEDMLTKPSK